MSYSKDHSRRNPLSPGRMYGLTSSANTNEFTPNGQQTTSTEEVKTSEPTTTVTKEKVEGGTIKISISLTIKISRCRIKYYNIY